MLILAGTAFKAPSGRAFLGNPETLVTALAVGMLLAGRMARSETQQLRQC